MSQLPTPVLQWIRGARVTLVTQKSDSVQSVMEGFRVAFAIENRLNPPEPTMADISVYNLSAQHRDKICVKDAEVLRAWVLLEVGYQGLTVGAKPKYGTIFYGTVRTIDSEKQGADWVTRIQCGDAERAWRQFTTLSFAANVTTETIVRSLCKDTGLGVGNLDIMLPKMTGKKSYRKGYSFQGKAVDELTKILRAHGMDWMSYNETLWLVERGKFLDGYRVVLNAKTGLIGSPQHKPPDKSLRKSTLKFQCFLNPLIKPWVQIDLSTESKSTTGTFTPTSIQHRGDTHGQEWYTNCEARGV